MPGEIKQRYFELIRQGHRGAVAARTVGVSTSCGSLWFLDAGGMLIPDPGPISPRYLTQADRIVIADGIRDQLNLKVIAGLIGKSFQTVYREVARNSKPDGRYQPWWAHNEALKRRGRPKLVKFAVRPALAVAVRAKLDLRWSPQQIGRYLRRSYPGDVQMHACAETIYRGWFAGTLGKKDGKLRTGRCTRKAHRRGVAEPNKIKNMRPIAKRPEHVRDRLEPGHWEGDLIIGKKMTAAIGTLVERTSRYVILLHLPDGYKAPALRDALIEQFGHLPLAIRKTLTWDQGREMARHEQTEAAIGTTIYFCDPHAPWQRPTNENTNGLIRQYYPKGSDLRGHAATDLQRVADELNNRPRLALLDRTPQEVMTELLTTCRNQLIRDHR
jgi:IS30 family transposase